MSGLEDLVDKAVVWVAQYNSEHTHRTPKPGFITRTGSACLVASIDMDQRPY